MKELKNENHCKSCVMNGSLIFTCMKSQYRAVPKQRCPILRINRVRLVNTRLTVVTTIAVTSWFKSMKVSTVLSSWAVLTLCHQAKVCSVTEGSKGTRFPVQSSSRWTIIPWWARMIARLGISCSDIFWDTVVPSRAVLTR